MSRYAGLNEGGIPSLVHDILETHCGDWFDIARIVGEVQDRRPEAKPETIRRAIERLKAAQLVEAEIRDRAFTGYQGNFGRQRSFVRVPWRYYWDPEERSA